MKTAILSFCASLLVVQASFANERSKDSGPTPPDAPQTEAETSSKQSTPLPENSVELCQDGIDNDKDSFIDCTDQDCLIFALCVRKKKPQEDEPLSNETRDQSNEELRHRPVSLALAPYVTTDGGSDQPIVNNFSLNFIGWGHSLHGLELSSIGAIRTGNAYGLQYSGLFNYTHGEMRGAQLSGLSNITIGNHHGIQGAGLVNASHRNLVGIQAAGLVNYSRYNANGVQGSGLVNLALGTTRGFQGAGIANVAGSDLHGFQGAGLANASIGRMQGFQGAGISNYTNSGSGAQISGIGNVAATDFTGIQIGLFNYATEITGAQIGLINIAPKKMNGATIGLINYAGNGTLAGCFWVTDNSLLNVGLKMGSKHVYSILGYGAHPIGKKSGDALIAGIGGHIPLTQRLWLEIDLTHYWMHEDFNWRKDNVDFETKLGATVGFRLVNALSIFAGPSLDLMISNERKRTGIVDYEIVRAERNNSNIALSPGFIAGIQIHPSVGSLNPR